MKSFEVFAVFVVGLVTLQLVEACVPSKRSPRYPFNLGNTSETEEFMPISNVLKLGAQRGLRECEKLFKESIRLDWSFIKGRLDPELPIFVDTTIPLATREAALIHAISSAAITYELTLRCRHNIRGCKCVKRRPRGIDSGCGDNFQFGQKHARRLFKKLEKGNGARTAVNLHNNKVGRKVVQTRKIRRCKYFNGSCLARKTCHMELASFETIIAGLKQRFEDAVPVQFRDSKLYGRWPVGPISSRLVYLDNTPAVTCARNVSMGTPGILGRTCRVNSTRNDRDCKIFIEICKQCNLKPSTTVMFMHYNCNCKFHWCCYVKCKKCTLPIFTTTCVANDEKPEYSEVSHDIVGRRYWKIYHERASSFYAASMFLLTPVQYHIISTQRQHLWLIHLYQ